MDLYVLRYLIHNDHDESEHVNVAKDIAKEFSVNTIRFEPATWLILTNLSTDNLSRKIKEILNKEVKNKQIDYTFLLAQLFNDQDKMDWRLPEFITKWLNTRISQ